MMHYGLGGNWLGTLGWGLSMLLYIILPVAILVGLIYLASFLWGRRNKREIDTCTEPLDIVRQRFARGEITSEEFRRIKEELQRE